MARFVDKIRYFSESPLLTLSVRRFSVDYLIKIFNCKSVRDKHEIVSRFILLNKKNFEFLDISITAYEVSASDFGVELRTGKFAGAIPVCSPLDGNYSCDLSVACNYSRKVTNDDIFHLLTQIGETVLMETNPNLSLTATYYRPPLYFESINYIDLYLKALKSQWSKFVNKSVIERIVRGATDWNDHALNSYNPENALIFKNRINTQTFNHKEWNQLNYVLSLCSKTLASSSAPGHLKNHYNKKLRIIFSSNHSHTIEKTRHIQLHVNDPINIKALKKLANEILGNLTSSNYAWRLDAALIYERYLQFLFAQVAISLGASFNKNTKFPITGEHPAWSLRYLEPDMLINKSDHQIIIDAKYKSHMLSDVKSDSTQRKEAFRADIHQLLAYLSLNSEIQKYGLLVYPLDSDFDDVYNSGGNLIRKYTQQAHNPYNSAKVNITLVGVPLINKGLNLLISELRALISSLNISET